MRIGIFGGTFDPPHIGHRAAAERAAEELCLDKLLVIPTATPPHKILPENAASGTDRLEMTRAAFRDLEIAEILDIEIQRGGRSFTVDTVEEISRREPTAQIFLFMGTDMFLTLDRWKDWRRLVRLSVPTVFSREHDDIRKIETFSEKLRADADVSAINIRNTAIEVSSTQLRSMLPIRGGREYLDEDVYEYIIANRLYGAKADFDWLRQRAHAMLKPKRVPHVVGCEEEAVRLAQRWGADQDEAREAAILHDITKKLSLDEQLLLCDKYGIINDNVEKQTLKLLHSKTGAEIARACFGVSDAVYEAVRWHTTGRPDMSLLEKIIYLADYIEPTRDFEGLDELRRLAYTDLDSALILGLEMSIDDLKGYGVIPHVNTENALEYMLTAKVKGTNQL